MAELLARLDAPLRAYDFFVRQTALWPRSEGEPHFEEMLFRIGDGWIDTPLGSLSTSPSVFTSFTDDILEKVSISLAVDEPIRALLALAEVQQLIACLGSASEVTIELYGDPAAGFASELRAHGDETTVRLKTLPDGSYVADVPEQMPDLFADGRFQVDVHTPAPTVIETTAESLERIVDAVEAFGGTTFPLVTREEGLVLDVARHNVFVEGPLDGQVVEGPSINNVYGPGFANAVRTFDGPVRLETEPGGPLAIVREEAGFVGRTILDHH